MKIYKNICAGLFLMVSQQASAQVSLMPATCTNANLNAGVIGSRTIGNQNVYVRRLATIKDEAIDDFGNSAPGDSLEVFCVSTSPKDEFGILSACLSKESCPWR